MKYIIVLFTPFLFASSPCKEDIQKFCKDVQAGGGRLVKCLKEHENELSAGCKEKRAKLKEGIEKAHEACKNDVEKLCPGVKPGDGRVIECLKAHEAEISAQCKAERQNLKTEFKH